MSLSRVLADHWLTFLAGHDPRARSYCQRAYAAYTAYRRAVERDDASPWTDVGGEG